MGLKTHKRLLLIISCVCFAALTIALVVIGRQPPAAGYELSIYSSVSAIAWVCLAVSTGGGIYIAVYLTFSERVDSRWLLGLGILVLGNLTILLLPVIRGYFLYASADTIAHTMWAQSVISSAHFEETNRYPIIHILASQLALVCDLPSYTVLELLPALFSVLFAGSSYLLGSVVLPKHAQAILAGVSGSTLFFGYYHVAAYPQALSLMVLPLVFYLYFSRYAKPSLSFRILFVVFLLFFPFFHPATAVVLIVCLAGVEITKTAWKWRTKAAVRTAALSVTAEPALIAGITFFAWISTFGLFGAAIRTTFQWLQGEIEHVPRVTEIQSMFASQGLSLFDQIILALRLYGDNLAYLVLSVVALMVIAHGFLHRQENVKNLFILSVPFVVSGPVWVLIFVTTLQVTLGRLLGSNVMMWATPVLAAFSLHEVLTKTRVRVVIVAATLLCASVVAMLGVYHSPFVRQVSWQITRMDIAGTNWFTVHQEPETPFATLGVPPAYALSSVEIPEHFNYQEQSALGTSFERDTYLLMAERFKAAALHPALSGAMINDPRLARPGFTYEDFNQLGHDRSIGRIYTNGEFDIYLIRSQR